jgi:flagellum-specific ATP synthase
MTATEPLADKIDRSANWRAGLKDYQQRLDAQPIESLAIEGRLTRMVGLTLEAVGFQAAIGSRCEIIGARNTSIEAEVVGFSGETLYLMPTSDTRGLVPNARVRPLHSDSLVPVGDELLGRVVDAACKPLDGKGPLTVSDRVPLHGEPFSCTRTFRCGC